MPTLRHKGKVWLLPLLGRVTIVLPVNVVKPQSHDFTGPQAIDGQQHQNGSVADVVRAMTPSLFNQSLHNIPGRTTGDLFLRVDPGEQDAFGQAGTAPTSCLGKAEKGPQRLAVVIHGFAGITGFSELPQHDLIDRGESDPRPCRWRNPNSSEEIPEIEAVVGDSLTIQSPSLPQFVIKVADPFVERSSRWSAGLESPQETQPGRGVTNEQRPGARLRVGWSVSADPSRGLLPDLSPRDLLAWTLGKPKSVGHV